jgi:NADPH:quinone reductase-like Zn-dependent oxidoreductase
MNPIDWKRRDFYEGPLPFILGQDFAGRVVGLGNDVQRYALDERVLGIARENGAYAEYTVVPEDDHRQPVAKIPDGVSDAHAAALPTAGLTALAGVERLGVRQGQVLLIVGITGAIGQYAAQMARARGARIAGTGKVENEPIAAGLGVEVYAGYDRVDVVAAMRARYPNGVDAVFDLADDADAIKELAAVLRPGGSIASTIHAVDEAYFKSRGITGINVNLFESPQSSHEGLSRLVEMVERGVVRVPPVTERSLADAVSTLELVKSGQINAKVVLLV